MNSILNNHRFRCPKTGKKKLCGFMRKPKKKLTLYINLPNTKYNDIININKIKFTFQVPSNLNSPYKLKKGYNHSHFGSYFPVPKLSPYRKINKQRLNKPKFIFKFP